MGENVPCALLLTCAAPLRLRVRMEGSPIYNKSLSNGRPPLSSQNPIPTSPSTEAASRRGAARDRAAPPEASRTAETNRPEEEAIRPSPIALSPSYLPVSLGPNSFRRQPPFSSVRIRSSVLAICGGDSAGVLYQTSMLYCIIIIL